MSFRTIAPFQKGTRIQVIDGKHRDALGVVLKSNGNTLRVRLDDGKERWIVRSALQKEVRA